MYEWMEHYSQYISEYKRLRTMYADYVPMIFCTYYRLDTEISIYDNKYNSAYELLGNLTGLKWDKILLFPVTYGSFIQNNLDYNEKGIVSIGTDTQVTVVLEMGLTPKIDDLLIFNDAGATPGYEGNILYRVKNIEISNIGSDKYEHKLSLEAVHAKPQQIENQVHDTYIYVDTYRSIYENSTGTILIDCDSKAVSLEEAIRSYIDTRSGYYRLTKNNTPDFLSDLNMYINTLLSIRADTGNYILYPQDSENYKRESFNAYTLLDLLFSEFQSPIPEFLSITQTVQVANFVKRFLRNLFPSINELNFFCPGLGINVMTVLEYTDPQVSNLQNYLEEYYKYKIGQDFDTTSFTSDSPLSSMIGKYLEWKNDDTLSPVDTQIISTNIIELMFEYMACNEYSAYLIENERKELS